MLALRHPSSERNHVIISGDLGAHSFDPFDQSDALGKFRPTKNAPEDRSEEGPHPT